MDASFHWLPVGASDAAHRVDVLFLSLVGITGLVACGIFATILYFCIRYRRGSSADRAAPPTRNIALEAAWIGIPIAVFVGVFTWAAYGFSQLYSVPADATPFSANS